MKLGTCTLYFATLAELIKQAAPVQIHDLIGGSNGRQPLLERLKSLYVYYKHTSPQNGQNVLGTAALTTIRRIPASMPLDFE